MNAEPEVSLHRDAAEVAHAVADHLLVRLSAAQLQYGYASVVLTGGSIGTAALRAVASSAQRTLVNWSMVDFWWGDERFVGGADPGRNYVQACDALLDALDVDPERVHPMGSCDDFPDVHAAAASYAQDLAAAADVASNTTAALPRFDVLLLGVGPDAHVASLFPEMAGIRTTGMTVTGVENSPKPPPFRVSLTLEAITSAQEVVLAVGGDDKAGAVGLALAGASPVQVPAAGARGRSRTLWMIDRKAAVQVPSALLPTQ